jgi:hypothetical protein
MRLAPYSILSCYAAELALLTASEVLEVPSEEVSCEEAAALLDGAV